MAKPRKRDRDEIVREKAREALFDMETPIREVGALLRALDLIGLGTRGRGDEGDGEAVSIVADLALARLVMLKTQWKVAFRGVFRDARA